MLLGIEREYFVYDVIEFVKKFQLQKTFKEDFNLNDIDDYEYEECDQELIEDYLTDIKGNFLCLYDEKTNIFRIIQVIV